MAIGLDAPAQIVDVHAKQFVDGHAAQVGRGNASHAQRFGDRVMRLRRGVDQRARVFARVAEVMVPRGDERGEVGHRRAARQQTACVVRVAELAGEPLEHVLLESNPTRCRHRVAGEAVSDVGDQIGEARRVETSAGHVGQVAGARGLERGVHRCTDQLEGARETTRERALVDVDAVLGGVSTSGFADATTGGAVGDRVEQVEHVIADISHPRAAGRRVGLERAGVDRWSERREEGMGGRARGDASASGGGILGAAIVDEIDQALLWARLWRRESVDDRGRRIDR